MESDTISGLAVASWNRLASRLRAHAATLAAAAQGTARQLEDTNAKLAELSRGYIQLDRDNHDLRLRIEERHGISISLEADKSKLEAAYAALREQAQALVRYLDFIDKAKACEHPHRAGGNDYIMCDDCGLMWDYRRETYVVAMARFEADRSALAALRAGLQGTINGK